MRQLLLNRLACMAFLCGLCACKNDFLLPIEADKMVTVLTDIHIAEAIIGEESQERQDSLADNYYARILTVHGMDRPAFDSCLAIMKRNPLLMQDIYEKVSEEITKRTLANENSKSPNLKN